MRARVSRLVRGTGVPETSQSLLIAHLLLLPEQLSPVPDGPAGWECLCQYAADEGLPPPPADWASAPLLDLQPLRTAVSRHRAEGDWAGAFARVHALVTDSAATMGAYASPEWLVRPVMQAIVDGPMRVYDPAMGTGQWLVAAARQLVGSDSDPRLMADVVAQCMHGADVDARVVPLARLSLLLLCPVPARP